MCGKGSRRGVQFGRRSASRTAGFATSLVAGLAAALAASAAVIPAPARAESLWDSVLEKMNVKAAPAAPGPDFVERTRPDPAELGYLPTATPHKVSPLAVKTAAQIEAEKDALDAAKTRQLNPGAPAPLQVAKTAAAAAPGAAPPARAKKRRPPAPAAVAD